MKSDQETNVESFLTMVKEASLETITQRTLPLDTVSNLRDPTIAEWFDLMGFGVSASDSLERITAISKSCPSTGWTLSVFSGARRIFSYLPIKAQEGILVGRGDVLLFAAGLMPAGVVEVENGKTVLSGRWPYVSGADYADYLMLAAQVSSNNETELRFFPVPREAVTVEDTWTPVGLGATRTNAVVVTKVEVDIDASCLRNTWLHGMNNGQQHTPGTALSGLTFLAPALGAAYLAFDCLVKTVRRSPLTEYEVSRLAGMLHSVQLLLSDNAVMADGGLNNSSTGARIDRNSFYSAEVLHEASSRMKALGGTSGLMRGALGSAIADLDTAVSHIALRYETAACRTFPNTVFGVP